MASDEWRVTGRKRKRKRKKQKKQVPSDKVGIFDRSAPRQGRGRRNDNSRAVGALVMGRKKRKGPKNRSEDRPLLAERIRRTWGAKECAGLRRRKRAAEGLAEMPGEAPARVAERGHETWSGSLCAKRWCQRSE